MQVQQTTYSTVVPYWSTCFIGSYCTIVYSKSGQTGDQRSVKLQQQVASRWIQNALLQWLFWQNASSIDTSPVNQGHAKVQLQFLNKWLRKLTYRRQSFEWLQMTPQTTVRHVWVWWWLLYQFETTLILRQSIHRTVCTSIPGSIFQLQATRKVCQILAFHN